MTEEKKSLEERLNAHPHLKARFESIIDAVENGDIEKADEIEEFLIKELRDMGKEALHDWAFSQESRKVEELRASDDRVEGNGKKK